MEGYIGEIRWFAPNFQPRNWAYCDGRLLPISQNTALFSILGTTYGGDGITTFALPDFRGRVGVGTGTGPGLPNIALGEKQGSETTTVTTNNIPPHTHSVVAKVNASPNNGSQNSPQSGYPAAAIGRDQSNGNQVQINMYGNTHDSQAATSSVVTTVGNSGGGIPMNNIQPSLGMNYIICMYGIFPSRG
jgi:microcystin-dependent protein